MTIRTTAEALLDLCSAPLAASPRRTTMPVLEGLFFEREGDRLRITGTDLEVSASAISGDTSLQNRDVEVSGDDVGASIPFYRLGKTLKALVGSEPITLRITEEEAGIKAHLDTDSASYEIAAYEAEGFPDVGEVGEGTTFDIDGATLASLIERVQWATSGDALRPAMQGIYFDLGEQTLVATDGHRLARVETEALPAGVPGGFIIPADAAAQIAKQAAGEENVTITTDGSQVRAEGTRWTLTARLVDETYPNYGAVIPERGDKTLRAEGADLRRSISRVGLYASGTTNQFILDCNGQVSASARSLEESAEAEETLFAEHEGEGIKIGFNATYAEEALRYAEGPIELQMSSPNRAARIVPEEQEEGEEFLMLLMPVMVSE